MIFLLFLFFLNMSFVSFASVTHDFMSVVESQNASSDPIKAIEAIEDFHKTFRIASSEIQNDMIRSVISTKEEAKKLCQDSISLRSRLVRSYQNSLLACAGTLFCDGDIFASEQIDFYHRFIVYSIDPEDQLYYQIEYIKNLKNQRGEELASEFQHFLIISLVDHCQEGLFAEQGKICHIEIVSKIARYYDSGISDKSIQDYFTKKEAYQMRKKDCNYLHQMRIIEKQKMLLMAIGLMRGFWANSAFIPFAKHPDGDCGNYCFDVCAIHHDQKHGALNAVKLLQDNSDQITVNMVNKLYPLIADQRNQEKVDVQVMPDNVVPDRVTIKQKKQWFVIRIFDMILFLCRKITAFFSTKKVSATNDDKQSQVILPIVTTVARKKHCSVSDEQYKKIKLQVADFKEKRPDETVFKAFLRNLYHDAKYSIDNSPQWFKYWHLKEALVASLLGIKIRMFVNKDKLEEVTQQEPCYDDASREVYVWTDSRAFHDSELVPLHCFALMAKAVRHENRYFGINTKSYRWLDFLQEQFKAYKNNWLDRG